MRKLYHFLKNWRQSAGGAALIETALVVPVLGLLALGGSELVRYVLIVQKVDKAAFAIGNVVAQATPAQTGVVDGITQDKVNAIAGLYSNLMRPYDDPARQSITIRSIRKEGGVFYQKWTSAGGTPSDRNRVVSFTGAAATNLAAMADGQNTIIVELSYRYEPILGNSLGGFGFNITAATLPRTSYHAPRNGQLICLPPTFLYEECWPCAVVRDISSCYYVNPTQPAYPGQSASPYCGIYYALDGTFTVDDSGCDWSWENPPPYCTSYQIIQNCSAFDGVGNCVAPNDTANCVATNDPPPFKKPPAGQVFCNTTCSSPAPPTNGGWLEGACSRSCGGGIQTRTCTNPAPANGGAPCSGPEVQSCNTQACVCGHTAACSYEVGLEAPYNVWGYFSFTRDCSETTITNNELLGIFSLQGGSSGQGCTMISPGLTCTDCFGSPTGGGN
jgi:hypothetical protein